MPGLYLFNELHFLRLPSFAEKIASKENRNVVWYLYILRNSTSSSYYKYEHGSPVKLTQRHEYSFSMTVHDLLDRIRLEHENAIIESCLEMLNTPLCVALAKVIRN